MDSQDDRRSGWPAMVIVLLLLACGFAVPILGPLRSSDVRVVLAVAILVVGAGLALLVEATGRW